MSESNRELFFVQLSDVAPSVHTLLRTYPSRIRAQFATGDVVNTYGVSIIFQVFIDVLTHTCKGCGETQFSPPNFGDCPNHRFKTDWSEIASGEATEGSAEALRKANVLAAEWLAKRGIAT